MTTRHGLLQLFIGLTAIASILIGVGGCIGYARLGAVAGQAVFVSPYFSVVAIVCGLLLYTGRLLPRYARLCAAIAAAAVLFSHLAPQWSEAWVNGRSLSAHLTTALILSGVLAVFWWQYDNQREVIRPSVRELPAAVLGLAASTFIAFVLIEEHIVTRQAFAKRSAEIVATNVGDRMARSEMLIQRLTERWSVLQHRPEMSYMNEAFTGYLRDFPFFLSLHLVDAEGSTIVAYGRDSILEQLVGPQELIDLLELAQAGGNRIVMREAQDGQKIGLLIAPLFNPEMRGWSVVASIDLPRIATWAMTRADDGGFYRITHGDDLLYQSADTPPAKAIAAGNISIPLHDDFTLSLYYAYSPAGRDLGVEIWAEFIWLIGVIVTYLLIVSQRLTLVARHRSIQLSHNALHDPLTGLPNRRYLEQTLTELCQQAAHKRQTISVVFFDLDGLKLINDSVGHDTGDEVLIEAARRLQHGVGSGAIVNQLGNDEFVLVFKDVAPVLVKERTEQLIKDLSKSYHIGGRVLSMTANAGIVSCNNRMEDPMELVRQADLAMLRAKQAGQNTCHVYTPDLSAELVERLELVHDLQLAIDNDTLQLHYQPIVDGRSGRAVGAEALLRWEHERHGFVSPARFIPLAEETGQIVALSDWVLATACRDAALLRERGRAVPIAVNISPLYFQRTDFIERIQQVLREASLPPQFLELEITEGVLVANEEAAIHKLGKLREIGIKTSIDDFGTGYSSLSYLKNLPIDKVKIDRSFVIDVVTDPADTAIVQAIISMAHHLGLTVVAEGVELEAQVALLNDNRCDAFQGYLFSRPKPFEEFAAALNHDSSR